MPVANLKFKWYWIQQLWSLQTSALQWGWKMEKTPTTRFYVAQVYLCTLHMQQNLVCLFHSILFDLCKSFEKWPITRFALLSNPVEVPRTTWTGEINMQQFRSIWNKAWSPKRTKRWKSKKEEKKSMPQTKVKENNKPKKEYP